MMAPNTPPPDWPYTPGPGDEEDPVDGDNAKSPRPQTSVDSSENSDESGGDGSGGQDGSDDGRGGDSRGEGAEPTGGVAAGSGSTAGGPLTMALVLLGFGSLAIGTGLFVQLRMRSGRRPGRG